MSAPHTTARLRAEHLVVALCLSFLPLAQAHGAPRHAVIRTLSDTVPRRLSGGAVASSVCTLGETGSAAGSLDIIDFSGGDDAYYTWLNLDSLACPSCGANSYALMVNAHIALYFPGAPETVMVSVNVVATVPVACHYPNYMDPQALICGPVTARLDCQDPLTVVDFSIPLPTGCLVHQGPTGPGQAFVGFTFLSHTQPDSLKPELATEAMARLCRSFNPIGSVPYDVVFEYQSGNPIMYTDVQACGRLGVTPGGGDRSPVALRAVLPNPARSEALVRFSSGGFPDAALQVTDLAGRSVATIASHPAERDLHEARWDLRDAAGARVRPGVYWVVLRAGSHREARAIAVLP